MINPLYKDGIPDINAIRTYFPAQGGGRIRHCTETGDTFAFNIINTGVGYEALIEAQPSYGGRDDGYHATHRLPAGHGGLKVCFKNPPADLPKAVAWTLWWADCTARYIRTGKSFS